MKTLIQLSVVFILFFADASLSKCSAQNQDKASQTLISTSFVSLKGEVVAKGNRVEADGNLHEINKQLETFAMEQKITFVNIGPKMLDTDGTILPGLTSDFCHPTEQGYQMWADEVRIIISEPF